MTQKDMTRKQRDGLRRWFMAVVMSELFMLWRHQHLVMIYVGIAVIFCVVGLKKNIRKDSNERAASGREFFSAIIALIYAGIAMLLNGSPFRFLLILCSSVIIVPYLASMLKEK